MQVHAKQYKTIGGNPSLPQRSASQISQYEGWNLNSVDGGDETAQEKLEKQLIVSYDCQSWILIKFLWTTSFFLNISDLNFYLQRNMKMVYNVRRFKQIMAN